MGFLLLGFWFFVLGFSLPPTKREKKERQKKKTKTFQAVKPYFEDTD